MRRFASAILLAIGMACLAAVQPAGAQTLLFDYVGFDYEDPDLVPGIFGGLGDGYVGIGEVPFMDPLLVTDPANNEYTYHLTGLKVVNRVTAGGFAVIDYDEASPGVPGTLTLYEDSKNTGTPFDYGVNPPNGTAPPSFVDGTAILVCEVTNLRFILNLSTGSGSYDSDLKVTGGTQYGNIPAGQLDGWQFAGVTESSVTIPQGYTHQVDGQAFLQPPTANRGSSWGQLKRRYR